LSSIPIHSEGAACLEYSPEVNALFVGGEDGRLNVIDYRMRRMIDSLLVQPQFKSNINHTVYSSSSNSAEISTLSCNGLQLGLGTAGGHFKLYDIRHSSPLTQHRMPMMRKINSVKFHNASSKILISDDK
jgi:WD40 repeat protein